MLVPHLDTAWRVHRCVVDMSLLVRKVSIEKTIVPPREQPLVPPAKDITILKNRSSDVLSLK
jgi:hypothetical protein